MKRYLLFLLMIIFSLFGCSIVADKEDITQPNITDKPNVETPEENNKEPSKPEVEDISYFGSDGDIYRINITTDNSKFPDSLSTYLSGSLNITEQDTTKVLKSDASIKIRLRGNSTIEPNKKPFKIKFDKKQSLFGLTAAKDWVLLANYYDKSNIRNYLAYTTANKLGTLGFQPSAIFVDVYINNDYQGLYLLVEQIEANEGRVDIKDNLSSEGISSFLLEVDERAISEFPGYSGKCYITLDRYTITFKYPKASDYVDAVNEGNQNFVNEYEKNLSWVKSYLSVAYDALKSNDYLRFSEYFDISSFVDYYLIQEFFKNVDIGFSSQYYIIDQIDKNVKIKCGPVWDFDISAGVIDDSQGSYIVYAAEELFVRKHDQFYQLLFQNNIFLSKVIERYKQIRPVFLETIEKIQILHLLLNKAQSRNIIKWSFPKERVYWLEVHSMSVEYFNLPSLAHHYEYLTKTLEKRIEVLDKYY